MYIFGFFFHIFFVQNKKIEIFFINMINQRSKLYKAKFLCRKVLL